MQTPLIREPDGQRVGGGDRSMQNVEFKAELRDIEAARQQCTALGAQCIGTMRQVDTYYRLADGRLKRRQTDGGKAQWIYYHRGDRINPRLSTYTILNDQQARRRWGKRSLKTWLTVTKSRELWQLDVVRIHLDVVEQLGCFIEFEAVIDDAHDVEACGLLVVNLREAFQPVIGEPVAVSYSDLMAQPAAESTSGPAPHAEH